KPRDKIEICFPVLHTVVARSEASVKAEFEILKLKIRKNLLNDVGNCFVLENPAIGRAGEEPQPGHHLCAVCRETPVLRSLRKSADEAVPVALGALRVENAQGDV